MLRRYYVEMRLEFYVIFFLKLLYDKCKTKNTTIRYDAGHALRMHY
jgi:hypothetical protein